MEMTREEQDHFEETMCARIDEAVDSKLDGKIHKLMWAVWVMILGGVGSLVFLGVQWGTIKTDVFHLTNENKAHHNNKEQHMPANEKYTTFVTREEWRVLMQQRDKNLEDMKGTVKRVEDKIDRLLESRGAE